MRFVMRLHRALSVSLCLLAAPALAQPVAASASPVATPNLPRGQMVVDIVTQTRHPAYLTPQALKTPEGVRILSSVASPDNARTCARGASSGTECRQVFRVTLDTAGRCQEGDYQALFAVACWPGTAASLCKPGAHQYDFKLAAPASCGPMAK